MTRGTTPAPVPVWSAASRAMPKSVSLTKPSPVISTVPGVTSRWVIPDGVRGEQRRGDRDADGRGLPGRQPALPVHELRQGLPVKEFHPDDRTRGGGGQDVEHGDDVRAGQRGRPVRHPDCTATRPVLAATARPAPHPRTPTPSPATPADTVNPAHTEPPPAPPSTPTTTPSTASRNPQKACSRVC